MTWFRVDNRLVHGQVIEGWLPHLAAKHLVVANDAFASDLLRQQSEGDEKKRMSSQLIPTAQHILEHYSLLSVEEKNRLWKLVLKKATVYRTQDDELMIHIYPNLPQ